MSQTATNFVRKQRGINLGERSVLYAIASHINPETRECYLSHRTIGDEASLDPRSVKRIIGFLEKKGILIVNRALSENGRHYGGDNRSTANHYRICEDYCPPAVADTDRSAEPTRDNSVTGDNGSRVTGQTRTGDSANTERVTAQTRTGDFIVPLKALKKEERYTQREPPPFPPEGDAGEVLVCGAPGDDVGILDDSPARLPDPPRVHLPQAGWAGAPAQPQPFRIDYSQWRKPGK